jgi:HYR domain
MKRLCLAVFMSMGAIFVAAMPGQAATVVPTPPGVQLTINTTAGEDHTDPHVSGDIASYTVVNATSNIHYYNMSTGVDTTIPNGGGFDYLSDVDNGRIAFSRSTPGTNGAIMLFDTATPSVAPIVLDPTAASARDSVSIGGNTVAWQDRTFYPNAQIEVYDLVTGIATALTNDGATMSNLTPDVSPDGTVVAWVKCQPDGITGCQVWDATRDTLGVWTSRPLTSELLSGESSHPATNGLIVVYGVGQPGVDGAIRYQPVGGGSEQTITMPASTGITSEAYPSISGDLVAFAGFFGFFTPAGSISIWVADLLLGTVYQVSPVQPQPSTLNDISLAADGTVDVVWQTLENGQYNVHGFRYQLDRTAPLLTLPANITVTATSSAGAVVNYIATASDPDNTAPQLTFNCSPASGSTFPIGTTTVNCTASDPQLNTTTGSFTVTVEKASPTITTSATASASTAGTTISDVATLSGGIAPTGTITFNLFGPIIFGSYNPCSGSPAFTSTSAVSYTATATSDFIPWGGLLPGTYRWVASYSGDPTNNTATTACGDLGETSIVSSKASPTITTQATSSANTVGTISDTATLLGGNAPTGSITFNLFGPDNPGCTLPAAFTSTKTVSGNGSYTSDPFNSFAPLHPGTYRWVASYSGDGNNNAVMTACNGLGETSAVTQASPGDLSTVVGQLLAAGCIDNAGIANALTAKLAAAQSAISAGNLKTAINILSAFIHQVQAQSGKHILASCTLAGVTFDPAAVLIADARSIIDSLTMTATPNPITGSVVTATGSGISGATVSLVDSSGKTLAIATTDVTGFYFFPTTGLLSTNGTYSVSVTGLPTGFTSSSSAQIFTWTGSPISFSNFTLT